MGRLESAGSPSVGGVPPDATSSAPRAATIAPLSVHSFGRGTRSRTPGGLAALRGQRAQPRVGRDAAADQQVGTSLSLQTFSAFRVRTSTTASWNDAATSATGTGSPARSAASTQRATAVFRPENEKS